MVPEVASRALVYARLQLLNRPVLINGALGMVAFRDGKVFSVGAVTVRGGRIVEMEAPRKGDRFRVTVERDGLPPMTLPADGWIEFKKD